MKESSILFLLVDESTDCSLEQYLIMYGCYLTQGGIKPSFMQFVELLSIPQGTKKVMYNKIVNLIKEFDWPLKKIVCFATNGTNPITGL